MHVTPDFGHGVQGIGERPGPRDLFCRLLDIEDNVHYLEPGFRFAEHAVASAEADCPRPRAAGDADFVQHLLTWARDSLASSSAGLSAPTVAAPSWPSRIAVEFAPTGLTDGVWLQGAVQINAVENDVGMLLLQQLMIRFGGPLASDAYSQRYASLLRSLGTAPASITRWERTESSPCAQISYEHALLGVSLAFFQSALGPEILGFNLWMAAIGPCPLLEEVAGSLRAEKAALAYVDAHDRHAMLALAESSVVRALEGQDGESLRARVVRGFAAAHHSYLRWERAMRGRNVPMTPGDCVLDIIERKAAFTMGHHAGVLLGGRALQTYFAGDRADHEALLDRLAASEFILPGKPDESRLIDFAIAFGGPMFDVFTASEQRDLREWIAAIGSPRARQSAGPPVDLAGHYVAPRDLERLRRHAVDRYGALPMPELLYRFVNADRYPLMRLLGRSLADNALAALSAALDGDARLGSIGHPEYTERAVAEIVAGNHARNVRVRAERQRDEKIDERSEPGLIFLFDGCWLQQFADVARIGYEEYGWLFRIYASELGDGNLSWNHNVIARQMLVDKYPLVARTPDDRRLYDVLPVTFADLIVFAMALNTRRFLPEMLGLNLAIEATGVGGIYLTWSQNAERRGNQWEALYFRLHNSIDNYASGHTKWSLAAVQAFMARIKDAAPSAVDSYWRRTWRIWRFFEIREHGTDVQKQILNESLGAGSFVPSVP